MTTPTMRPPTHRHLQRGRASHAGAGPWRPASSPGGRSVYSTGAPALREIDEPEAARGRGLTAPPTEGGDEVTRLLAASAAGESEARDRLATLLYSEIHAMASARMRGERADHTLGATALVNETFLRLFESADRAEAEAALTWNDRRAFFAGAATAMRRVLIDHARSRAAVKRGGADRPRAISVEADAVMAAQTLDPSSFLMLDEAMSALEQVDRRAAEVTRLKFFAGLDVQQIAELLEVSDRTVKRDWQFARAWLRGHLESDAGTPEDGPDGTDQR